MVTRRIGALEVSVVGLGCNNFGRRLDATQTAAVVDAALDAGITFFDTADVYGGGQSEAFIGQALGPHRDAVVIAAQRAPDAGGARFVSVQHEYSLLKCDPEQGVLAECERAGIAFLPYFPLASGLLTGKYRRGQQAPAGCVSRMLASRGPGVRDRRN